MTEKTAESAPTERRVYPAKGGPYRPGALGSTSRTQYMLIRQHKFPDTFMSNEAMETADSDRMETWGPEYRTAIQEHVKMRLEQWLVSASPEAIMEFIIDAMKARGKAEWTGFRVLGSVHLGNGYEVFSYALFAKDPESKTQVYSGYLAPNVQGADEHFIDQFDPDGRYIRRGFRG